MMIPPAKINTRGRRFIFFVGVVPNDDPTGAARSMSWCSARAGAAHGRALRREQAEKKMKRFMFLAFLLGSRPVGAV